MTGPCRACMTCGGGGTGLVVGGGSAPRVRAGPDPPAVITIATAMPATAARRVGRPAAAGDGRPETLGVAWWAVMAASWWLRGGRSTHREPSAGVLARPLQECDTRFHA